MDDARYAAYVDALRREGDALVRAARAAGPDAAVPACDGWTVADLCSHVGRLHRWVAWIVAARPAEPAGHWRKLEAPEGGALVDFAAAGYPLLADALASAAPGDETWSWTPDHTAGFWARRQAVELAVHRVDAQASTGTAPAPVARELAVDGVQEYFDILPARFGADAGAGVGETIHLHCTDGEGEWLVRREPSGMVVTREHAKGDVALRGPASDLLLFLWGRVDHGTGALEVFGDAALLDAWRASSAF